MSLEGKDNLRNIVAMAAAGQAPPPALKYIEKRQQDLTRMLSQLDFRIKWYADHDSREDAEKACAGPETTVHQLKSYIILRLQHRHQLRWAKHQRTFLRLGEDGPILKERKKLESLDSIENSIIILEKRHRLPVCLACCAVSVVHCGQC